MSATKVARFFSTLDSTNAEAIRFLRQQPLPAAWSSIRTDYQTAGRGQAGNSWFSSVGQNLLFSVILYPQLEPKDVFRLTQGLSIALVAALSSCSFGFGSSKKPVPLQAPIGGGTAQKENLAPALAKKNIAATLPLSLPNNWLEQASQSGICIKWPNDIYLQGKKLAGMLIQNSWQGQQLQWTVMGVGLNVNETQFPAELASKATSLRMASNQAGEINKTALFDTILAYLPLIFDTYVTPRRFDALHEAYHRLLYRQGGEHSFRRLPQGTIFTARLQGVTPQGLLLLQHPNGQTELFDLKTIAFL